MKRLISFKQNKRKINRNLKLISILLLAFTGCAAFQTTQKYDISPFANSMISVAGDIQYSLLQYQLIAVRKYAKGPAVENFQLHRNKLRKLVQGIIAYSIEIVTITESNNSESEKAKTLASYLENLKSPALEKPLPPLDIKREQFDTLIANVRTQKKFLDALGAAQPLIDEVARIVRILTEETKLSLDSAYDEISDAWTKEYQGSIWAEKFIKTAQLNAITAVYYGTEYTAGNENSLDSIYKYDPFLKLMFPEGHKLTTKDILEVDKRLIFKLETVNNLKDLFHKDIAEYEDGLLELDKTRQEFNEALRKAGVAVLMWSRAHLQLSRGVTEPAEIDIVKLMMGTASKVVPGL